jgi:hypothetical protein
VNADDPAVNDGWMQAHSLDKNWGPFLALHRTQPQAWINAPGVHSKTARRYRSQTSFVMWVDGAAHQIVFGEKAMEPRGMGTAGKGGDFTVYAWIEQDYNASGCARNGANSLARYSSGAAGSAWNRFGSWHPNICQFAFGDGRVEPLQNNIRRQELEKLCNRANGGPCIQIGTVSIGRGYNCDVGRTSF